MLYTLLRNLKHKLYLYRWLIKRNHTNLDFIGLAYWSLSARWTGEIQPVVTYLGMFDTLREQAFEGKLLELGGGYSTILAAQQLNIPSSSVTSVDVNPKKYERILNSKRAAKNFLSSINNITMMTIKYEDIDIALSEITNFLETVNVLEVDGALSSFGYTKGFVRTQLIDDFKKHKSFADELRYYEENISVNQRTFCSEYGSLNFDFDAYFFDCGEISSVAEFWLLEKSMKERNFVLLHDIMYPKSIKNFIIATYLTVSKDWQILYLDNCTPQGGLVAQKVS